MKLQITNQLVISCKKAINMYLNQYNQKSNHCNQTSTNTHQKSTNIVWNGIENDILQVPNTLPSSAFTETAAKPKRATQQDELSNQDFLTTLNACLSLHKQYRDQLRHLRDSLGGSHALQHVPVASVGNSVKKYTSPSLGNISVASSKALTPNFSLSLACEYTSMFFCSDFSPVI